MASDAAGELLSGPRGRRLCWTLLDDSDHPGWARVQRGVLGGDLAGLTGELTACVTLTDLTRISAITDELALLPALGEPVNLARYWGPPDEQDLALSDPVLTGAAAELAAWRNARCWPVEPQSGTRIYEVLRPAQWADLVGSYPLDVSKARRHEWWQVTGLAGRWLIPDFAAVAADYDAIHVSIAGYLATAGRAVPVGDARTVMAGWDPDQTFWLADVLAYAGPATAVARPGCDGRR
jgi:hypothetical protein